MQDHSTTTTVEDPEHRVKYRPICDEYCLPISPAMVKAFGYSGAMFLSQVHGWLQTAEHNGDNYKYDDGQWWTWNSYTEWQEQLYCMDVRTIKRTVARLELRGVLLSKKPDKHKGNHSKWYSIDYDKFNEVLTAVREEFAPEVFAGGDKVSLVGGDTMPQGGDTMTPVGGDTMTPGSDKVSLSYIEPNNSPNIVSNNQLEGECEGEGNKRRDGRKNRDPLPFDPSDHQAQYLAATEELEKPLGHLLKQIVARVGEEQYSTGNLAPGKKWRHFASPLIEATKEHTTLGLAFGLEQAIAHSDKGLRATPGRLWPYVKSISKKHPGGRPQDATPPGPAAQQRPTGLTREEEDARRIEGYEHLFNYTAAERREMRRAAEAREKETA